MHIQSQLCSQNCKLPSDLHWVDGEETTISLKRSGTQKQDADLSTMAIHHTKGSRHIEKDTFGAQLTWSSRKTKFQQEHSPQ